MVSLNISDIRAAMESFGDAILHTDCSLSVPLSKKFSTNIFVKYENRQHTCSFKVRGAFNKLSKLTLYQKKNGVITMSAGNHAQGVAYNSNKLGIPSTIIMPDTTPFTKIRSTKQMGAEVIIQGSNLLESEIFAKSLAQSRSLNFIHPYDDIDVIAGQGTIALEMLTDVPNLDILVVPVGGGGLISGCLVAAKSINPKIKIVAVEIEKFPSLYNAINKTSLKCSGSTLAEGIAVANVGSIPLSIIRDRIDQILVVSEAAIERAVSMFALLDKTVAEGAGAAGLAAIIENSNYFSNKNVGLILCGGNIDSRMLSSVLMRDMIRQGQVKTLSVTMPDKPGQLKAVSSICAEAGANVLAVDHSRFALDLAASSARLQITIETRDHLHATEVTEKIKMAGFIISKDVEIMK